jgi:hypothetical protein
MCHWDFTFLLFFFFPFIISGFWCPKSTGRGWLITLGFWPIPVIDLVRRHHCTWHDVYAYIQLAMYRTRSILQGLWGYMGNSNRLFTFGLPIAYAAPRPLQIRQRNVYHMIRAFDPDTFGVKCSAQWCFTLLQVWFISAWSLLNGSGLFGSVRRWFQYMSGFVDEVALFLWIFFTSSLHILDPYVGCTNFCRVT